MHGLMFLVAALVASQRLAAEPVDDEEILVTGERLPRPSDDTSSSLVVITARDLEQRSEVVLDDLLDAIPNVVLGSGGVGPTIRGQDTTGVLRDLPAFIGGNRPRTTVIVDGRAITYNEFAFGSQALWDVERVEIYLSPQTTTQGRNSTAGAIFVETLSPENEWHQKARLQIGDRSARQASLALTGPIVEDQLAFRISGDIRRDLTDSELTSPVPGIDPNRDDFESYRVKLLVTPAQAPDLEILATYSGNRSQAPQIEGVRAPFIERRDPAATYGIFRTRVDALTLRADWSAAPGWNLVTTASLGNGRVDRIAPVGLGEARNLFDDRSLEAILRGRTGSIRLVLGTSLTVVDLDQAIDVSAVSLGKGSFEDRQTSLGIFGNGIYDIGKGFSIEAGGRFQQDRQDRNGTLVSATRERPFVFNETFEAFSYNLALNFEPTANLRVGASTRLGFNPGGGTLSPLLAGIDRFDKETVRASELFARWRSSDGAWQVEGNVFLYRLTDAQRAVLRPIATPGGTFFLLETGNVPQARSHGGELRLRWAPSPKLATALSLGFLDTRIVRAPAPEDPLNGKAFQRAPNLSSAFAVAWRPIGDFLLSADFRYRSGYFSDDINTPNLAVGPVGVLDLRAERRLGAHRAYVSGTNVLNRFYLTSLFGPLGDLATLGDQRRVEAGIELRF